MPVDISQTFIPFTIHRWIYLCLVKVDKMGYTDLFSGLATPTAVAATSSLFLAAFLFYRWLLPTPIPGIPFNPEALKSLFGDIPSLLEHLKTSKTISTWVVSHSIRHNAPMVQVFANPFGKPWVVINDVREGQVRVVLKPVMTYR